MPLQNRVTPLGEIVAVADRGLFMGNRGCLHNEQRQSVRPWDRKAWVTCVLSFNGRRREIMAPKQYTELFFLDEATALAAGHRPCRSCRREEFDRFKELWIHANPELADRTDGSMAGIDKLLHAERVDSARRQRTWSTETGSLPTGVMIRLPGDDRPMLLHEGALFAWAPGGYEAAPLKIEPETRVEVLTPLTVVNVITAGYAPSLHHNLDRK
jgi:hypothetical protein